MQGRSTSLDADRLEGRDGREGEELLLGVVLGRRGDDGVAANGGGHGRGESRRVEESFFCFDQQRLDFFARKFV